MEFKLTYYRKENGGKHTALNFAHPYIKGELVIIVDSDDYLIETAVETIETEWKVFGRYEDIGIISYLRGKENGEIFSKKHLQEFFIDDDIHYRVNKGITGDRCEVVRTNLLKEYPFPSFEGEKFMSEGWFWRKTALGHKTLYRNEVLYICEYLEGGLTKSGRPLRMRCPLGMMENCKTFFFPQVKYKVQLKEMLLFWVYGLCADYSVSKIARVSGRPLQMYVCMPIGFLLYKIWKKNI